MQERHTPKRYFNPRSPWGERLWLRLCSWSCTIFQSTLPVGGATVWYINRYISKLISIHAPRGGSDLASIVLPANIKYFNPRSPWGERRVPGMSCIIPVIFQSTLPVGGATLRERQRLQSVHISIHAPRGGSDVGGAAKSNHIYDFNPRSPWGERRPWGLKNTPLLRFQSTLPVGGATNAI